MKRAKILPTIIPELHYNMEKQYEKEILLASMTLKTLHGVQQFTIDKEFIFQKRDNPNIFYKFILIIIRKIYMTLRSPWYIQLLIPILAAFIIGKIHGTSYLLSQYPNNIIYAIVCMGVLSMITHIRTFALDKIVIRRESDNRISIVPYYIAYNIVDLLWIFMIPFVFMIPYYYFIIPKTNFITFYGVAFMVCWWCSGASYIIAALPLALQWANLIAVFIALIFGAFLQGIKPSIVETYNTIQGIIIHISYNRWAMEILTIKEFSYYDKTNPNIVWPIMDKIGLCGLKNEFNSINIDNPNYDTITRLYDTFNSSVESKCNKYIVYSYLWLFFYGSIFRIIAFIILYINSHPIIKRFMWKILSFCG